MKHFAALVIIVTIGATYLWADEEKIPLDKLPKEVKDAVLAKFPKAELKGAEKEVENGKTIYEVNLVSDGSSIEVSVTPDGKIVSIEKTIAEKDVPKAVAEALAKKYPKATTKKIEEITKGKAITYEFLIETAEKKKLEVVFDPDGKLIEEEDKSKEKKE
jgi:uncharacterized membrane protein YkoI